MKGFLFLFLIGLHTFATGKGAEQFIRFACIF